MRRVSLYVVTALAAAGLGYALFQFGVAPRMAAATPPANSPAPVSQPEPAPAENEAASELPVKLPDVAMEDREGQTRSIASWTGKSMIVNFWATWCAPCRREIPLLKDIQQEQAGQGVQVVGIAIDTRDKVLEYADKSGINYPVLIGEEGGMEAATQLGQGSLALPFTAFTDQQHRIVATHAGELTRPQAEAMLSVIARLNRGELTLEAARTLADEKLQAAEG